MIKGIIDALASVREMMKESDHVSAILNGLTEEYFSVYNSVLTRSESITITELEALLLAHESMLAKFRKPEAFMQENMAQFRNYNQNPQARRGGFRGGFRGRGGRSFSGEGRPAQDLANDAQFTSGRGQLSRGGRIYSEDQFEEESYGREGYNHSNSDQLAQPEANFCNTLSTPATVQDPNWYPDSGATHHMTHEEQNLMEKEEYCGKEQVVIGNGTSLQISFVGSSCFKTNLSSRKGLHHHQQQQNHLQIPFPHTLSYLQNLFGLTHNPFAPPPSVPQTLTPIPNSNIGINDLRRLGFSVETAATTTTNISNNSNTIVDAFVMQQELKLKFGSLPKEVED
ncbi:uncharacterized protein LOC107615000 [Arachis ipaensis]|uniref:uncharacterized protein LOC107615000 n=1 Tax=Arachis ipaensis TaxID=130454 RepID=UPI0007AF9422|nr:uncharacterized protein LOC107615000 [Arachis ipaensis]